MRSQVVYLGWYLTETSGNYSQAVSERLSSKPFVKALEEAADL